MCSPSSSPIPAASSPGSSSRAPCSTRWSSRRRSCSGRMPPRSGCSKARSSSPPPGWVQALPRQRDRGCPWTHGPPEPSFSRAHRWRSRTPAATSPCAKGSRCSRSATPRIWACRCSVPRTISRACSRSSRAGRGRGRRRRSRRSAHSRRTPPSPSRRPSSTSRWSWSVSEASPSSATSPTASSRSTARSGSCSGTPPQRESRASPRTRLWAGPFSTSFSASSARRAARGQAIGCCRSGAATARSGCR